MEYKSFIFLVLLWWIYALGLQLQHTRAYWNQNIDIFYGLKADSQCVSMMMPSILNVFSIKFLTEESDI